ncbi:MAG: hypothetical protein ACR2NP_18840 [Pirellulaceae bacterium]
MSQIALEMPARHGEGQVPWTRFQAVESPLPKSASEPCCPHCHLSLEDREPTTLQRLKSAVWQLLTAVFAIVLSVLRLARLIAAMAFCLVGVIGFGLSRIGARIVHPDDLRLLPLSGRTND